jgi:hypothetical protein
LIANASWRLARRQQKVDRRRKSRIGRKRRQRCNAEESEVGSAGRAGRWTGGANRRLAGKQRRKDAAAEESEVEFEG